MLNYAESGFGTPVVLVHGFSDQSMSWFLADPELFSGFRVIAVDLPGHGRSSPWGGQTLTMHDMSEELYRVVHSAGVHKFALIGHSMGGMVAQQYSVEHPGDLSHLFLCCTAARGELLGETAFNPKAMKEEIQTAGIVKALSVDPYSAFAPGYDSPFIPRYLEMEFVTDGPTAIKCLDAIENWRLETRLARAYAGPAVIICGEKDAITPCAFAAELAGSYTNASVEVIKGSGHMVFLEKPGEFKAIVKSHLAGRAG